MAETDVVQGFDERVEGDPTARIAYAAAFGHGFGSGYVIAAPTMRALQDVCRDRGTELDKSLVRRVVISSAQALANPHDLEA